MRTGKELDLGLELLLSHVSKKRVFYTLALKVGGDVYLENNQSCKVQGIGTILLKMSGNVEFLLRNVSYVLKHKRILILISIELLVR
jgi:hypothetical protein